MEKKKHSKFKIKEVFKIKKVFGQPLSSYESEDIPYVTGSEFNNGIVGYVSAPKMAISEKNCISVDPIKGFARYQPFDFVGRVFSGASINLLYNKNLTELNALYGCSVIEKVSLIIASYTNLFNGYRLADAEIELPVQNITIPDWSALQDICMGVGVLA